MHGLLSLIISEFRAFIPTSLEYSCFADTGSLPRIYYGIGVCHLWYAQCAVHHMC